MEDDILIEDSSTDYSELIYNELCSQTLILNDISDHFNNNFDTCFKFGTVIIPILIAYISVSILFKE